MARLLFLFNVICVLLIFSNPTLQKTVLVAPVSKDKSTQLFSLSVFLKTPLRPKNLYTDLSILFPRITCGDKYNSSSFREIPCDDTGCLNVGFGGLSCANCSIFDPPDPNCNPSVLVCDSFPENPVTQQLVPGTGIALIDTLALRSTNGPLVRLPNFTFACSPLKLLKGLPKKVDGLVALGRANLSLQAQISTALSSPNIFAICFPSSPSAPGKAFFGSTGRYNVTSSNVDLSKFLIHTPFLLNPVHTGDTIINYRQDTPSRDYFIGLTSIQINGKPVHINGSLLIINKDDGFGGTKISTNTSHALLESSIHKAFTNLFFKEAASPAFNLTVTTPSKPFNVCYHAQDLTMTPVGPLVPTIDLVLHAKDVAWRIQGANSMVRVTNIKKRLDLWCLAFVDSGINPKTPIVIGGKQLEDNLLQFDLESNKFGFTSSLLFHSLSCGNFNPHKYVI